MTRPDPPTAIQTNLAAIFISLELSRSIWLITSLSRILRRVRRTATAQAGLRANIRMMFQAISEGSTRSAPFPVRASKN
jgi:hypothetical protein